MRTPIVAGVAVLGAVLTGCGGDDVDIGDTERFRQDVYLDVPVDIGSIDTDCTENTDCQPAIEIGGITFTVTDTPGPVDGPALRTEDDAAGEVRTIVGVDPARWLVVDTSDGPRVAVGELVDRTDPALAVGPVAWPDGTPVPLAPPTPRQPPYERAVPAETAERLRTAVLTGDLPVDHDPEGFPCEDGGDCALSFTVGGVVYGAFGVIDLPGPSGPVVADTPHGTVHAIPGVDPAWVLALDDPDVGPIGMLSSLAERAGVPILTPLDTGPVRATLTDDDGSGTIVELDFTGEPAEQRGICWTIEHWDTDPGIWVDPHHVLAAPADQPAPSNPGPVPIGEPHECPAEALTGPGPDHIRLPTGFLRPGTRRICTTIGDPAACTTFRTG